MQSTTLLTEPDQGRQPKKWIENIKQDIDTRNIQFDKEMAMMHDRVKWRLLVAALSWFFSMEERKKDKKR